MLLNQGKNMKILLKNSDVILLALLITNIGYRVSVSHIVYYFQKKISGIYGTCPINVQ